MVTDLENEATLSRKKQILNGVGADWSMPWNGASLPKADPPYRLNHE